MYIMASPKNEPGELEWSACSKRDISFWRPTFACLREKVKPIKPSCRNGILEEGEQCECVSKVCDKCCNITCQLTENSECSSGPCCDKTTCKPRIKEENYPCRMARDSCDIPEMCSGRTAKCPVNYVLADGYGEYSPEGGYCFNGMLGSRKDVCEWVFTNGTVGEDDCYKANLDPDFFHGCGPILAPIPEKFIPCKEKDIFCGKIFCEKSESFTREFSVSECKSMIVSDYSRLRQASESIFWL